MNKYKNKQCSIDGKKFASQKEAERYLVLKDKQRRGEIYGLACQQRYTIFDGNTRYHLRPCVYVADFCYIDANSGKLVVEDVKGYKKGAAWNLFMLKRRKMLERYGIWVNVV